MMTLRDAYEDHIENEKFSKIVKENLRDDTEFTDGFIVVSVLSLMDHYMIPEDHGYYFDIGLKEKRIDENDNSKKVFFFEFQIDVTYDLFGLVLNTQGNQYIDTRSICFWLMADNFVCIYWSEEIYKVMELSEFIKLLKNPVKLVKSN